ncbi:MAG: hypothetical protein DSY50_05200 [Desulfobulbus sp.]|nr:MAG: hypothetical protein DSY50_05200 [Desulfobulbus sp.]
MKLFASPHVLARCLLTVLLMVLGIVLTLSHSLRRWDLTLYDILSTLSYKTASDNVLILAIDENSLAEYGRWPWPRSVHAELINKLKKGGAKVIGYDVFFTEENQYDPEGDLALAEALADNKRVILPVFYESTLSRASLRLTPPLPMFKDAAAGLGHVNLELDPDGIARRALLTPVRQAQQVYPPLVLAMLNLQDTPSKKKTGDKNWQKYENKSVYVSFTGPPGHFPALSLADYLKTDFPATVVKDKYILVGATALGLGDNLPTAVSGKSIPMPGIEYNANLLSGLLTSSLITPLSMTWRLLLTAFMAMLPMLLYPFLSPRQSLFAALQLLAVTLITCLFLLHGAGIWLPPSAILIVLGLSYPLWIWRRLEDTIIQLFREKERAQVILNSIGDGVIATDVAGKVEYMNPVAETLTGFSLPEARGKQLKTVFPVTSEDKQRDLTTIVDRCLDEERIISLQSNGFVVNRENREHIVQTSAGLLRNRSGKAQGVVLGITDVTATHKMMRQMTYQATHDLLTGLPNRSLLFDRLTEILEHKEIQQQQTAIFFIDLDQFKKVNDQVGHYGGDQLLQVVAKRLQTCCGKHDVLAHLGSDKYVVALNKITTQMDATKFADRLINVLAPPFPMAGQSVFISCHIGICLYPKDGTTVDELLKNADTAMYNAKKTGRDFYRFFSRSMDDQIQDRLEIEQKLRAALARDELEMYYQPQVVAQTGQLAGAESLIRWNNSENGPISPGRFIPVAEDCGLILPIGVWILKTVCLQAKKWQDQGLPHLRVAVNLSAKQFLYGDIYNNVCQALAESDLAPEYLELEITESLIMEDVDHAIDLLTRLKQLGTRVSIDDFGTGYSSLSYLKHFPVDQLKIDQSFVHDIVDNPGDSALTLAIITMAHGLNLGVIAEGVEDEAQLAVLRQQKCDEIQGYFFSRPLSAHEMTEYLRKQADSDITV